MGKVKEFLSDALKSLKKEKESTTRIKVSVGPMGFFRTAGFWSEKVDLEGLQEKILRWYGDISETMIAVIRDPADFYRRMSRGGGFLDPMVFAGVMAVIVALIGGVFSLVFGGVPFFDFLLSLVVAPAVFILFSFIGAGVFFILWRIMGSDESYETAYRCFAYASAITPVTTLIGIVPYLGSLAGILWMLYLVVVATVEVHGIEAKKAWTLFGVLFFLLAVVAMGSQYTARHVAENRDAYQSAVTDEGVPAAKEAPTEGAQRETPRE